MELFLSLLIGSFVVGGTRLGDVLRRRPVLLVVATAVMASGFYSLRVVW